MSVCTNMQHLPPKENKNLGLKNNNNNKKNNKQLQNSGNRKKKGGVRRFQSMPVEMCYFQKDMWKGGVEAAERLVTNQQRADL